MKAGVNIESEKVYIETNSNNASSGLNTTVEMNTKAARILARQLIASADMLDDAASVGLLGD